MRYMTFASAAAILTLLSACGGGGDDGGNTAPPPPPPPVTGIGAAGGTVSDPSGAKVVVPAGALTSNTQIAVAQSSAGAPPLPAGTTAFGQIFAFTPHGTTFATPVTITVPFDSASVPAGTTPALYKTNATQSAWELVSGATVNGNTMQGNVSGFSYVTVTQISQTQKHWEVDLYKKSSGKYQRHADGITTGVIEEHDILGTTTPTTPYTYAVHSTETGRTFWTQAVAPLNDSDIIGTRSNLTQTYYFRVDEDSPHLSFLITHASITAFDDAGALPSQRICPWLPPNPTEQQLQDHCAGQMTDAVLAFRIIATGITNHFLFFRSGGELELTGRATDWRPLVTGDLTEHDLFYQHDFEFDDDTYEDGTGRSFLAKLREPKRVEVPMYGLNKGDIFSVQIFVSTHAINRIQGESLVGVLLRDPLQNVGTDLQFEGLTQVPPQEGTPASAPVLTCTTGPDPAAGTLQFSRAEFSEAERSDTARLLVERTGGTTGDVSVRVHTADGSAAAGGDYEAVAAEVRFADGEAGPRRVEVPLVNDDVAEDEETVIVVLSDVGGCAQLSAQPTATLTILDDDRPLPPPASYTVSGMVTGLTGSGLVLKELSSGVTVAAINGAFSLPNPLADGTHFDIRVDTPPSNPVQQCTVSNGAGTVAGANVVNVQVTCAAPAPSGGLDPLFGSGGRVATDFAYAPGVTNSRIGMALQGDGKILLVGGLTLLRFNADGTLDASFGSGGQVHVPFTGGVFDTAQDVAVQADGKIVVVGFTTTLAGQDDFALVRFDTSGAVDPGFGTGGKVITDFSGSTDRARRIRIQADGKLLVAGFATFVTSPTVASETFALARYNADGSLDTTFATGGKAHDSPAGSYDYAQGLAIQGDGKIVVVGGAASDGVADPDVGIVRYLGDTGLGLPGWRDESFGALGNGVVQSNLGLATGWEEAVDVVIAADGSLMVAGRVRAGAAVGGSDFGFTLAPFGSDGRQRGGALITKFSNLSDNARSMVLQSDGKIVVVGQSANLSTNPDMAIVRYAATGTAYDTTFGADGKFTIDFFGGVDGAEAVVQQPDGKLIVGGFARFNGRTVLALARVMP